MLPCCIAELLFTIFEPLIGASSIEYANGEDWEDRRKWLYESLKGSCLESYISHFVEVVVYNYVPSIVLLCLYIRYPMRLLVDGHSLRRILLWSCKKSVYQ